MQTISVSELKAHLSEELKKVQNGARITILDHKRPVATLEAYETEAFLAKEASVPYVVSSYTPLITQDPVDYLEREREDSW